MSNLFSEFLRYRHLYPLYPKYTRVDECDLPETTISILKRQLESEKLARGELEAKNLAMKKELERHNGMDKKLLVKMDELFDEQQRMRGVVNKMDETERQARLQLERKNEKMKKELERQVRMDRSLLNKMDDLFDEQQRLRDLVNKMDVKERLTRAELDETNMALLEKTRELESLRKDLKNRKIIF
jgi:predicted RNA-binding protein